jgi:hypothetical protein
MLALLRASFVLSVRKFLLGAGRFEDSCNHLISEHGLRCLHAGSETHFEQSTSPAIATVAVFGK